MKPLLALSLTVAAFAQAPNPDAFYKLGPDSLAQDGVPKGEMRGPFKIDSKALSGDFSYLLIYVAGAVTSRVGSGESHDL